MRRARAPAASLRVVQLDGAEFEQERKTVKCFSSAYLHLGNVENRLDGALAVDE